MIVGKICFVIFEKNRKINLKIVLGRKTRVVIVEKNDG